MKEGYSYAPKLGEPVPFELQTPTDIDLLFLRLEQFRAVELFPPSSPVYQYAYGELIANGGLVPTVVLVEEFPLVLVEHRQ
jgi:hypothetical protein